MNENKILASFFTFANWYFPQKISRTSICSSCTFTVSRNRLPWRFVYDNSTYCILSQNTKREYNLKLTTFCTTFSYFCLNWFNLSLTFKVQNFYFAECKFENLLIWHCDFSVAYENVIVLKTYWIIYIFFSSFFWPEIKFYLYYEINFAPNSTMKSSQRLNRLQKNAFPFQPFLSRLEIVQK
jgi:hypothetical protein